MLALQHGVGTRSVSIVRGEAACHRSPHPPTGIRRPAVMLTPPVRCSPRGCDARAAAGVRHLQREHRPRRGSGPSRTTPTSRNPAPYRDAHAAGARVRRPAAMLTPPLRRSGACPRCSRCRKRCSQRRCDARAAAWGRHMQREHRARRGSGPSRTTPTDRNPAPCRDAHAAVARVRRLSAMLMLSERCSRRRCDDRAGAGVRHLRREQRARHRAGVRRARPASPATGLGRAELPRIMDPLPRRGRPVGVPSVGQP